MTQELLKLELFSFTHGSSSCLDITEGEQKMVKLQKVEMKIRD